MPHMGYTPPPPWQQPPWQPPPPPRNAADVSISVILMVLTVLAVGAGGVMGLLSLAFLDYCPPESCSVDGAVTVAMATVAGAGLIGLTGVVFTIVRLSRRSTAWPFALATLAACLAVFFLGAIAYTAVVG